MLYFCEQVRFQYTKSYVHVHTLNGVLLITAWLSACSLHTCGAYVLDSMGLLCAVLHVD